MARNENPVGEGSRGGRGVRRGREGGRYARYTEEQIEILEKVYAKNSNPNCYQRAEIMSEEPLLTGIDKKQLKVWFQNRRCREKQKKEYSELEAENKKLTKANKALRVENNSLQKKLAQLMYENEDLRNQVLHLTSNITTRDLSRKPEASTSQLSLTIADNNNGLLLLAEETKNEFLSKAIGTAVNWTPVRGLKLRGQGSVGTIFVSSTCIGVAARAHSKVPFEPIKTIEILKDRPSWSRCCRNMEVVAKYHVHSGGTIELIYTQHYAPTIMAFSRDFWTLRYTSVLDDGSFVVCEKSASGSDAAPSSPASLEFVRGRMLASGYLVRPCEGGSTIYLVDHLDLEASSAPEVVRPLYESSEIVAKTMTVCALNYIEHVANETNGKQAHACREDPTFLRSFSQRLSKGFNDAITGFAEDGWTLMNADASSDVIMSINRTKIFGANENYDSVICVKASLLLQNVFPGSLVSLLKECRSAWMNFDFADHSVASGACYGYPGFNTHNLSENTVLLGHTNLDDEVLEVIRFERLGDCRLNVSSRDLYYLQVSNGMEDTDFGACSELIFAPIDRNIPNDAVLFSSGFRIYFLGSNTGTNMNVQAATSHSHSMLILAFQFPFESHLEDEVAAMARKYVQHVISSVKNISQEIMASGSNPEINSIEANPTMELQITPESTYAANLANLICQSYRSIFGAEILGFNCQNSVLELIQHHQYAILCFSFSSMPVCLHANQTGLNMLETTLDKVQTLTMDKLLGVADNVSLSILLPAIIEQGYVILPPGCYLSEMNRSIAYEQAVVWKVPGADGSIQFLALAFINWSFI